MSEPTVLVSLTKEELRHLADLLYSEIQDRICATLDTDDHEMLYAKLQAVMEVFYG